MKNKNLILTLSLIFASVPAFATTANDCLNINLKGRWLVPNGMLDVQQDAIIAGNEKTYRGEMSADGLKREVTIKINSAADESGLSCNVTIANADASDKISSAAAYTNVKAMNHNAYIGQAVQNTADAKVATDIIFNRVVID
jgi:hypothetical protein